MVEVLLIEGSQLRVVPDLIPEPGFMLRALRILGVILQVLAIVIGHLLCGELYPAIGIGVSHIVQELAYILGSLTSPVADAASNIASPFTRRISSSADNIADIPSEARQLLPRSVVVLCLVCVCRSTEICGKLMITSTLIVHAIVVHHIAHSLVFLHLPVNSFSTIGIRLASVPVCNILWNIGNGLPGILSSLSDITGDVTSPVSSTSYSASNVTSLLADPVANISDGFLSIRNNTLANVVHCPFSHSGERLVVAIASFSKLRAHAVSAVSDVLSIETLEIFICVSAGNELANVLGGLSNGITNILSSTSYSATDIPGLLADPVTGILNRSADVLGGVTGPVADILSSTTNGITNTVEESSDSAASLFSCLTDSVADVLRSLTDSVANVLCGILHVTGGIANPLTSAVEETGSALFGIGSGFRGSILDVVRSATDPLTGTIKESLGTFSGFVGSARYSITYVLSCLAHSVANILCRIGDIRCFLGSTRDGITNILSSLAYSIGNIVCGSGNLLPRGIVVLFLIGVCGSSEIGSELMITSAFIIQAVVVHHIAHSLVFLNLAVNSFGTIGIRLASIPVCNILSSLADSVADILGSSRNSPSGRVCNILKGFSSILSGLTCKVLNALSSARQRILGRIDCSLCNARQGLGLLLVIVVRGSLLGLLWIAHRSSCRALILILLPVLIASDKVRALVHSSPGSPCSIGDAIGHILSNVSSESPDILAGVLQPLDVAVVSIDAEFMLIPFHALHTVVLEAVFAVKWNASDVVFSHVHAPPFEG